MANPIRRRKKVTLSVDIDDTADGPAMAATPAQLLDVAERLFADKGIDSVSIRQIVQASNQSNASAAHYHFGSRESLIAALMERRMRHIDAVRHKRLDKLKASGNPISVHAVLTQAVGALGEVVKTTSWGRDFVRVAAQALSNPQMDVIEMIDPQVLSATTLMESMVRTLLPELPTRVLEGRIEMAKSEAIYAIARWVHTNSHVTPANARSFSAHLKNISDFVTGGIVAPVGDPEG